MDQFRSVALDRRAVDGDRAFLAVARHQLLQVRQLFLELRVLRLQGQRLPRQRVLRALGHLRLGLEPRQLSGNPPVFLEQRGNLILELRPALIGFIFGEATKQPAGIETRPDHPSDQSDDQADDERAPRPRDVRLDRQLGRSDAEVLAELTEAFEDRHRIVPADRSERTMKKGRAEAAFWRSRALALRELFATAGLVQTNLLPLDFAGVACDQARFLQHRLER